MLQEPVSPPQTATCLSFFKLFLSCSRISREHNRLQLATLSAQSGACLAASGQESGANTRERIGGLFGEPWQNRDENHEREDDGFYAKLVAPALVLVLVALFFITLVVSPVPTHNGLHLFVCAPWPSIVLAVVVVVFEKSDASKQSINHTNINNNTQQSAQ